MLFIKNLIINQKTYLLINLEPKPESKIKTVSIIPVNSNLSSQNSGISGILCMYTVHLDNYKFFQN